MFLRQRTLVTITAAGLLASGLTGLSGTAHAAVSGPPARDGDYSLSCEDGTSVARATTRHTRVQLDGGSMGRSSSVKSRAHTLGLKVVTKRSEKTYKVDNPCRDRRDRQRPVSAAKPTFTDKCGVENDKVRFAWTKGVDYYLNDKKVTSFDADLAAKPGDKIRVETWRGYRLARDSYRGGNVELSDVRCERPRHHRVVKAVAPNVTDKCGVDKDTVRFAWAKGVDYYLNGTKVNTFDKELAAKPGDRVVVEPWRGYRLARDSYRGGNLDLTDKPCEPKRGHGHR
ncbi:ribosomal protein S17 [Kineosphaera limosa]|uniref:Uncharacterized protein n=1 Tax=Kineosphaera limosa NBRC 100340 TaxID=1184609 RepID=K6WFI6_9MICO|nr:hypothetical protein [Kineosphaera limosa]NYE02009.1 ribosomal protein S17 [Kineosphaera limosa]GAB98060.1 hypothetical protein KILIM_097_00100 [Kineosphaera limosa NBRC 100340]